VVVRQDRTSEDVHRPQHLDLGGPALHHDGGIVNRERQVSYAELIYILDNLPLLVREKRRRDGLSIRAAAKLIGIPFGNVDRFERGLDVNVATTLMPLLKWVSR
jgi:hypothetical protein